VGPAVSGAIRDAQGSFHWRTFLQENAIVNVKVVLYNQELAIAGVFMIIVRTAHRISAGIPGGKA
jgi:predicted secreted protein